MDIKNARVFHRDYLGKRNNPGRLVSFNGIMMKVQFDNSSSVSNFKFYDAFLREDPLFLTRDKNLLRFIEIQREKFKCMVCGTQHRVLTSNGKGMICDLCKSKSIQCQECRQYTTDSISLYMELFDETHAVCSSCAREKYVTCNHCNRVFPKNSSFITVSPDFPDEYICVDPYGDYDGKCCANELLTPCTNCKSYFSRDSLHHVDGMERTQYYDEGDFCEKCIEQVTAVCPSCGKQFVIHAHYGITQQCVKCNVKSAMNQLYGNSEFFNASVGSIQWSTFKSPGCKSVPIFSRLNGSSKESPFDILIFKDYLPRLDLVVVSTPKNQRIFKALHLYECTITELKADPKISNYHKRCNIGATEVRLSESTFLLWREPYLLKASTYKDRNYGKSWSGRGMYEQTGNEFGDTSPFFAIGMISR